MRSDMILHLPFLVSVIHAYLLRKRHLKQNILIETNVKGLVMVPNVQHDASNIVYVKSMAARQLKLPSAITC